jgi:GNAT superfamily N-acetyltransferase
MFAKGRQHMTNRRHTLGAGTAPRKGAEMDSWVRYTWDLAGLTGADQEPPSGFHLVAAAPHDEAAVLEVVLEAYGSDPVWAAMLPAIERRMRARVAETLGRPSCEYIALTQQDRAVAISGIAREHWTDQNLLTGVCVRPEFQRRGLGTFLLGYSLERLRRIGLATARVYTESGSLADRKIYPLFGGRREEAVVYPGAALGGERRTQEARGSGGRAEKPG